MLIYAEPRYISIENLKKLCDNGYQRVWTRYNNNQLVPYNGAIIVVKTANFIYGLGRA